MKRFLALLFILILILSGCAEQQAGPLETSVTDQTEISGSDIHKNSEEREESIQDIAASVIDSSEGTDQDPQGSALFFEPILVDLTKDQDEVSTIVTDKQFLLEGNHPAAVAESDENKSITDLPVKIEKSYFEGERLNSLFYNDEWIVNRYKFASDSNINWLSFYPRDEEWDVPLRQIIPEEGQFISDVALGDNWMFWVETPMSSLGFSGSGWNLYVMNNKEDAGRILFTSGDLQNMLSIVVYQDELYYDYIYEYGQGRNEIRRYNPYINEVRQVMSLCYGMPGREVFCGDKLVVADHDGKSWIAKIYHPETETVYGIRIPVCARTERIMSLRLAKDWLVYTTVTDRPGSTYAYNMETGEVRILADYPCSCQMVNDRYLLLDDAGRPLVLYDLQEDLYYEVPESELRMTGSGAEFTQYGLAEIDGEVLIYETSREVSPALIVKLYDPEAVPAGDTGEAESAVVFHSIKAPDMDTIRNYVRGCEAFKDLYAEWEEKYDLTHVTINDVKYPGILSTEFLSDEEKNVSFRLIHATPAGDGYLNELFVYEDGEIISISEEPYKPSVKDLVNAPDLSGKNTLYLQNTLVSYYDVSNGVIDWAKSLSPGIVALLYSGLENLYWQDLKLSKEDRSFYSNALFVMGEEPIYFCIGAREDIMAELVRAYTPAGSLSGGVFYQGDFASAYIHPEAAQEEAAEFTDLLWDGMCVGTYLEHIQWGADVTDDDAASDWCYYRNAYKGWYHNENVRRMYEIVHGKLDLPAEYADAIPATPDETYDLVKAEVWGYDDHVVVTDPDILAEIETAVQSVFDGKYNPKTYLICYPLCFERADGVKLYAYPMMMSPGEMSQYFQAGDVWYKFPSERRDLWDMLGYRP